MKWMTITVVAVVATGCASAPALRHEPFRGDNPCPGRGELFHAGMADSDTGLRPGLPQNATIVRQATQRGYAGVCYTTPESLAAAQPS